MINTLKNAFLAEENLGILFSRYLRYIFSDYSIRRSPVQMGPYLSTKGGPSQIGILFRNEQCWTI